MDTPKTDELEKLQRADHDVLIGLKVTLDSFIAESRQARAEDGNKYADHEARIRNLETAIEVNKGATARSSDNRRTVFEVVGVLTAVGLIIATYLASK